MEPRVQLTDGQIRLSEMGRTLIHEHVYLGMPGWNLDLKSPKNIRTEAMARAVDRLQELRHYDCRTIVDPCPMDLGRDVEFVAEAAQRAGVNVVCATGIYTEAEGIPYTFRTMPREDIVDLFMKEITDGVGETGIRAGVIKIASGHDPTSQYEQKMIAVATEVSRMSGLPIVSHTHLATFGHEQVNVVEQHGGHANCMVVGHSGDRDDSAYQISIAQRGAFVGLDRFGLEMILPDDLRMKNLLELVHAGYRDKILISHDYTVCLLGRVALDLAKTAPKWSLTHIFERILPRLIELGLPQEDVKAILVDNPRQLFANAAALPLLKRASGSQS
jgi:phosphotriesterase-related protein